MSDNYGNYEGRRRGGLLGLVDRLRGMSSHGGSEHGSYRGDHGRGRYEGDEHGYRGDHDRGRYEGDEHGYRDERDRGYYGKHGGGGRHH